MKTATCRHCGKELSGKPYSQGGEAYDPVTKERARVNHYGGYVCSYTCDRLASLALERSMPGHGWNQQTLGSFAQRALEANWEDTE